MTFNFKTLLANLKANPIPAIGGLLVSVGSALLYFGGEGMAPLSALLSTIGGALQMFAKQSTTTGGTSPNAVAVSDTVPINMQTSSVTIVAPQK